MIHHVALDDTFRSAEGWVTADRYDPVTAGNLEREDRGSAGRGLAIGLFVVSFWWFGVGCGVIGTLLLQALGDT